MSDWDQKKLSDLADIRISNVDKISKPREKSVHLCNYMDVYSNEYITDDIDFMESTASLAEITKFRINRGDVILTKDSETPYDIGIPAVVTDDISDLVCGYHLALVRPDTTQIDPIYLAKQLASDSCARYFSKFASGSTRYGLSKSAITGLSVPLAPKKDQEKIAAILSGIDKTIEQTQALIEKYQKIKTGLMHDLFTRGVTADGKLRPPREEAPELYKESLLGWIPKKWDFLVLEDVLSIIDPQPDHRTPPEDREGIPYIGIGDFNSFGELDIRSCRKILKKAYKKQIIRFSVSFRQACVNQKS